MISITAFKVITLTELEKTMKNTNKKNFVIKLLLAGTGSLLISGFLSSPLLAQDDEREGRRAENR